MSLKGQIQEDLTNAMKAREEIKVSALRMLKAEIMKLEVSGTKKEATDEDVVSIIQKQVKQQKDSEEQFRNGGREKMADKEAKEAEILSAYLPEQMSKEDVKKAVQEAITQVGATSKTDMGKVMGAVMPKVKGKADGKLVNKLVMELLG
ncbi:GatB/YqeY domain-containing protein [bacterium]|nr:GatB/YqeY domain-containing protein [bacterium]